MGQKRVGDVPAVIENAAPALPTRGVDAVDMPKVARRERRDLSMMAGALWAVCRPHQWVKNVFTLFGVLFAHRWDVATLQQAGCVFAAFCAVSSAVYVMNDALDVEADRRHPKKRFRPIASGRLAPGLAWVVVAALAALAIGLALKASPMAAAIISTYALMNVAYSIKLKHVVIVDVFIISAGFMLRILAGTVGLHIPPSSWLLLCGLMITLFLGFAKRHAEISSSADSGVEQRRVLRAYRVGMLEQFLSITAACTILSYALYTVSPETVAIHGTSQLVYTVPIIVYGMFRYLYLLYAQGSGQDTARELLTDRHLGLTIVSWFAATAWILA